MTRILAQLVLASANLAGKVPSVTANRRAPTIVQAKAHAVAMDAALVTLALLVKTVPARLHLSVSMEQAIV